MGVGGVDGRFGKSDLTGRTALSEARARSHSLPWFVSVFLCDFLTVTGQQLSHVPP